MKNRVEELNKETNELMNDVMKNCFDLNTIVHMDSEELAAFRRLIKVMHLAEEVMVEQAEMFDTMNSKLDRIITELESK